MKIESGKIDKAPECKECHKSLDGFTGEEGGPSDGDISICAYCGTVGKYQNDCSSIEPLTAEELKDIRDNEPEMWAQLLSLKKVANSVRSKMAKFNEDVDFGSSSMEVKQN